MKNLIALFVTCLLVFTIGTMSCHAQTVKGITLQPKQPTQAPASATATIVAPAQVKATRVILTEVVSQNNAYRLFRVKTIPNDSLTHFGTLPAIYRIGDTVLVSQLSNYR